MLSKRKALIGYAVYTVGKPLANIAKYRKKASELVDKVGFDGGPGS